MKKGYLSVYLRDKWNPRMKFEFQKIVDEGYLPEVRYLPPPAVLQLTTYFSDQAGVSMHPSVILLSIYWPEASECFT